MAQVIERYNVAAGKPYTTRDGQEKKQWINIGRATKWDDGGISIEFTAMPVGNWWDGKASLFVQDDSKQQAAPQRQQRTAPNRQPTPDDDFSSDDRPF
jgi:hypothetical protein